MPLRTRRRGHESDRQKWGMWSPRRVVLGHFYQWGKGGNGQKMRRRERVQTRQYAHALPHRFEREARTRKARTRGYTPARWRHPALPLVGDATPWSSSFVTSRLLVPECPLVVVVVVVVAVAMVACRCIGSSRGGGRSRGGWWWWSRRLLIGPEQTTEMNWTIT